MTRILLALLALFAAPALAVTIEDCASKQCPQAVFDSRLPQIEGTFAILHQDPESKTGRGLFLYEVHSDDGIKTRLNVEALPRELKGGMRVVVQGTKTAAAVSRGVVTQPAITPAKIIIVRSPLRALTAPTTSNRVLVIPVNFTNTNDTSMTPARALAVMTTDPGNVASFFNEASYGQQTLTVTVTNWLTINQAGNCSYNLIGPAAEAAAKAANPAVWDAANYNYVVYLFSHQSCGWLGLAYVGFPHKAWINGTGSFKTSVIAHEMGHNFGLYHAGSLTCAGVPISNIGCSVAEYGDTFSTMGNSGYSMHYNAAQKLALGWIPASSVRTHTTGTAGYDLDPLELPGGALYAVKIPTANPNRTYWLEYRQPTGFDAGLANYPHNGVQVRVAYPFEFFANDDTELLDMVGSGAATGTLIDGKLFEDVAFNVTICAGPNPCTSAPPPPPPPGPGTAMVNASFEVPALAGGYRYNPTGAGVGWTFSANSGVRVNGSAFGGPNTSSGTQTAFVQAMGAMAQAVNLTAGNYTLTGSAATRNTGGQTVNVLVDGAQIGAIPPTLAWTPFSFPFTVAADGVHTISFAGTVTADRTTYIDAVGVQ